MAKIVYGVAGEGFGHSSRSHLIGQKLIESGHDVLFVASRKSLNYLSQYFPGRVKKVHGLSFAYKNGTLSPVRTITENIKRFPDGHRTNKSLYSDSIESFNPDLVITDFEPFIAWWAWRNRVPFISIDHEHMLTHCRLEHSWRNLVAQLNAWFVTKFYYLGARAYVVVNFFKAPLKGKATVLAPPIIRPQVRQARVSKNNHIVCYSTDYENLHNLKATLKQFPKTQFLVYGLNEDFQEDNCTFKKTSTEGFLNDVGSSSGVVATAGFSLISEMLHLRKRMLLLPILGQYEQMINSHYIEKLGLGIWSRRLDVASLGRFLENGRSLDVQEDMVLRPDNDRFFDILNDVLAKINPAITLN